MTRNYVALTAGVAFAVVVAGVAHAADQTASTNAVVVIPWGAWAASLLQGVTALAITAAGVIVTKFVPSYLQSKLTEKVLDDAINYGFSVVEGAIRGEVLTVTSTDAVVAAAISYVKSVEPAAATWLGQNVGPVILSRLQAWCSVPAGTSTDNLHERALVKP